MRVSYLMLNTSLVILSFEFHHGAVPIFKLEEGMNYNENTSNRTQFYRNQLKSHLTSKSLQMSRKNKSWNHYYNQNFIQRKNWISGPLKAMSRASPSTNTLTPIAPKPNPPLNLLKSSLTAPVKQNPDIRRILEAYQSTLGRGSNQFNIDELIPIHYDCNQSLSEKYFIHIEEVNQFVQRLEFLSTLPQNELNENMQNWFSVMLLRTCWWFSFMDEEDMDMLRVSDNYGITRQIRLEPLFAFAQTIHEMNLNLVELALVSTYRLLMGPSTFLTADKINHEKGLTAKRRDYVLKLLYSYQKELYPEDTLRYARLLTALSELSYISAKLSENNPNRY